MSTLAGHTDKIPFASSVLDPMQFLTHLLTVAEALARQPSELATLFIMFQEDVARFSRNAIILRINGIGSDAATDYLINTTQYISYEVRSGDVLYGRCYLLRSSLIYDSALLAPLLAQLCGMALRQLEQSAVLQAHGRVKHQITLTQREQELLPLLCQGKDDAAIAEQLSIAKATAKKHRENISTKLGVNYRGELALVAYRERLCSPLTWL